MRRNLFWMTVVVVLLTLVGSTSYAAGKYVVSSSRQVKNGALQAADLSAQARASLRGQTGATGPAGPVGPAGPTHAYDAERNVSLALPLSGVQLAVVSVSVPAGSYVVSARLQGLTGTEANPSNNYRFDCSLASGSVIFDAPVYRVGLEPNVERYLTYQGAGTLASPGTITLTCRAGNAHDLTVQTAHLTAVRVDAVN